MTVLFVFNSGIPNTIYTFEVTPPEYSEDIKEILLYYKGSSYCECIVNDTSFNCKINQKNIDFRLFSGCYLISAFLFSITMPRKELTVKSSEEIFVIGEVR